MSLLDDSLGGLLEKAQAGTSGLLNYALPLNARLFVGSLLGNTSPVTASDLTPGELNVIRNQAIAKYINEPAIAGAMRQAEIRAGMPVSDPQPISPQVMYGDYRGGPDATGWAGALWKSLTDPAFTVGTSLGSFGIKDEGGRYHAYDTYQWNGDFSRPVHNLADVAAVANEKGWTPTIVLNALAEAYAPKVKRPVDIYIPK